jgi:hypothetical protein
MRPRFSLRTLLVVTTLAGVGCAWLTLPSWQARRLVHAIASGDLPAADQILKDRDATNHLGWKQPESQLVAGLLRLTLSDSILGKRRVGMYVLLPSLPGEKFEDKVVVMRFLKVSAAGKCH